MPFEATADIGEAEQRFYATERAWEAAEVGNVSRERNHSPGLMWDKQGMGFVA